MQFIVKGRNVDVTPALRQHAIEKISKVIKHSNLITEVEVELMVEKNPRIANSETVEVTLFTKGPVIRGKESTNDMYASIDAVTDKLERQIEKYKGKIYTSNKKKGNRSYAKNLMNRIDREEGKEPQIVKTKQFAIKPMAPEEAALQMELLGHDFFVFINADTEEVNVIYARKDKNYGLIEPTIER